MSTRILTAIGFLGLSIAAPTFAPTDAASNTATSTPPHGYGADFVFPLSNGFPDSGKASLVDIEFSAGGTLPNIPLGLDPGPIGILALQLVVYEEEAETAFFTELKHNISNQVPGFDTGGLDPNYVIESIVGIRAQEELHALAGQYGILGFGYPAVKPCAYTFPVTSFAEAILFANTFTDLVIGFLVSVEQYSATIADANFASVMATVLGQEAEQVGFYRFAQRKVPSAAPFLTASNIGFLYNHLMQDLIVPGSCPQALDIPILGKLTITSIPVAKNSTLCFEITAANLSSQSYITYVSGYNYPVTVKIDNIKTAGDKTTFEASFPFDSGFAHGLTIAAITKTTGPFLNADEVFGNATYGPGIIEI